MSKTTTNNNASPHHSDEEENVVDVAPISAAEIKAARAKSSSKKKKAPAAEKAPKAKTHEEAAVKGREELAKVAAKSAATFRNKFNTDFCLSCEPVLRPFPAGLTCPGCTLPIDDSSAETVFALCGSAYRIALAARNGKAEQPIYMHKGCLVCYAVVDPNKGKPCGDAELEFSTQTDTRSRINLDRNGLPVCCNHADDHALEVLAFPESDVAAQKDFLDKYGFVKIVPDKDFPDKKRWAEEHERVLHGFAVTHGITVEEFKKRSGRDNWAASYLNDTLMQESCMFGIFGTDNGDGNDLLAPFVQSRQAYEVRGKYLEAFANLLRVPDRSHEQHFCSGPCPYILIAKGASNNFPVSYLSPDTKCDSKERANPLQIMTGFVFFEETSRLLGGVSVAIGCAKPTKSNPVPFPDMVKTAFPRAQNLGHFKEDNPFVGAMVAIPTRPGEAILIRSRHPYCFFSGETNHTGMILAASDITQKGNTAWTRAESVLNGVVRRGDQNRTVIKYNGKIPPAPYNTPMYLPGVFDPVTSFEECAEDVFGLGKTDPSTWPPECRPKPVPTQVKISTEKSQMSDAQKKVKVIVDDDDDEPLVEEQQAEPKKKEKKSKKRSEKEQPSASDEEKVSEQQEEGEQEQPKAKTPRKRTKKVKVVIGEGDIPLFSPDVTARPAGDVSFRRDNTLNPEFMGQPNKEIVKTALASRIKMHGAKPFSGTIEFDEEEEGVLNVTLNLSDEDTVTLKVSDVALRTCQGDAGLVEALAKEARRVMGRPRLQSGGKPAKSYYTVYGTGGVKGLLGAEYAALTGAVGDMARRLSPYVNRVTLIAGNIKGDERSNSTDMTKLAAVHDNPSYVLCVGNSERDFTIRRNGKQICCRFDLTPGLLIELPAGEPLDVCVVKKGRSEDVPEEPWGVFHFFTADEAHAAVNKAASSGGASKKKNGSTSATAEPPKPAFTPEQRGKSFKAVVSDLDKLMDKCTVDQMEAEEIKPLVVAASAAKAKCAKGQQGNTQLIWAFQDAFAALHLALTGKEWSNGRTAPPPDHLAVTPAPAATHKKQKKAKSPSPAGSGSEDSASSSSSDKKKKAGSPSAAKRAKKIVEEEEREVVEFASMGETNLGAKNLLVGIPAATRKEVLHTDGATIVRRSNREFKAPKELNKQAAALLEAETNRRERWTASEKARQKRNAKKGVAFVPIPYEAYRDKDDAKAKPVTKRGRDVYDDEEEPSGDEEIDLDDDEEDDEDDDDEDESSSEEPLQKAEDLYDQIHEAHPDLLTSDSPSAETAKEIEALKKSLERKETEAKVAKFISLVEQLAKQIGFEAEEEKDEDALYGKASRGVGSIAAVAATGTVNVIKKGFNADVDAELTGDFVDSLLALAYQYGTGDLKKMALAMRIRDVPEHQRFSAEFLRRFIDLTDAIVSGKKNPAPVAVAVADPAPAKKKEEPVAAAAPVEEDDGDVAPMEEEEDDGKAAPMEEDDDDDVIVKKPVAADSDSESDPTVPSDDDDEDAQAEPKDRLVVSPVKATTAAAAPAATVEDVYLSISDGLVLMAARGMDELREMARDYLPNPDDLEKHTKVVVAPADWRNILRLMRKDQQPSNLVGIEESKLFPNAK